MRDKLDLDLEDRNSSGHINKVMPTVGGTAKLASFSFCELQN
jgi:hypothetical protein